MPGARPGATASSAGPPERHTARTIVDALILARESDAARARGYATDDGEFKDAVRGVAAPVFIGGEAVAAIGVSGRGIDHTRLPST